jgi:hypothetical protein
MQRHSDFRLKPVWFIFITAILLSGLLLPVAAIAQGQDSTPAERNLRVIAEILPGEYNNANQHYFDKRRKLEDADRHLRIHTSISRIDAPAFGEYAFLWVNRTQTDDGEQASWRIATLSADGEAAAGAVSEVTMRHYFSTQGEITIESLASLGPADLRRTDGCDYYFNRRASHFFGKQRENACQFEWEGKSVYTNNVIELSNSDLWFFDHKFIAETGERISGVASAEPYWLERARVFHCYADIPGVGGGRDIPFERYEGFTLHDKGGMHWFTSRDDEKRKIGLMLQAVTWQVLNEDNGNFNRNSLVIYAMEELEDGSIKEHGYAFTAPDAERIGMNMKWMLVNCSITPRDEARPEM